MLLNWGRRQVDGSLRRGWRLCLCLCVLLCVCLWLCRCRCCWCCWCFCGPHKCNKSCTRIARVLSSLGQEEAREPKMGALSRSLALSVSCARRPFDHHFWLAQRRPPHWAADEAGAMSLAASALVLARAPLPHGHCGHCGPLQGPATMAAIDDDDDDNNAHFSARLAPNS